MRLTRPNVTRLVLPPGKSETIVFDDALPGFGVRVRAGGKRTWIAQYRLGTKQRRITLGSVEAVDPDEARTRAKRALADVQLGNDPQAEKSQARARAAITLGSIAVRYLDHAKTRLRPRSYEEVERHLTRHWAPLREMPIHDVGRRNIAGRLDDIAKQHGPFASNRARASLSAMFTWAMRQGEAEANPVIATGKATDEISRDRVLSDLEITAIWQACRDDDYGRIVRLLILTGQRREEVGAMCWSEIDRTKGMWRLPMSRTKNGLPHDVPLSAQALDIIEATPVRPGRNLIFGQGEGGFQGWSNSKTAMDKRISEFLKSQITANKSALSPWRLHDLRRTMVTQMNESLGILPHVVEAVVNHITGPSKMGVAGVYNRAGYAAEKRISLERWAEYVFARINSPK
ncbi:tyrosine-type recombinase/integrase [Methylobacterium haplocladii]|uniref:tyrosine-type recombinase/integrase n=1 Tax=Methylobacterium haplocladii TaxID=1176176 RepID=UPI0011BE3F16|nr:site-specific integrase [Methylobacterium haplocladii]